ncbi:MAG: dolichyl-phosphate-mannose--protein mannosyltransferase [Micromonosporaceae bacterium]
MPDSEAKSWLWVGIVGLIAAVLRIVSLAYPDQIIFDETYYANEAHSLLSHGAEWDLKEGTPKFVVHPPLGKWLIAVGIHVFGFTSFGWRIAAAVAGVASVIILARLGRRLFRSTALGCVAGLLLALDGMHFVSSRTALLDIFLMVFILASFACLARDRDVVRQRWLQALHTGWTPGAPLPSTLRRWRIAAAVLAGCALAVKWSAVWYIALFLVLVVVWDHSTMRAAGVPAQLRWGVDATRRTIGWALGFGGIVMSTYLASWTGWFADDGASHRHWLRDQGYAEWPVLGDLYNLIQYHAAAYQFHTTLVDNHHYQSWPWQWLLLGGPVAYYWSDQGPCGAENCAAEVLLLGTPLLWWSFIPALIAVFWQAMSQRDWRAWAILAGSAMGIVPWFLYQLDDRTMFYFYALPSAPFLVLAVTMALGMLIGPASANPYRRRYAAIGVAGYIILVGICFWYFYPIYTGEPLPYEEWRARMWLDGLWI